MAGEIGHTAAALERKLFAQGSAYSFFQVVRLLTRLTRERGRDPQEAIRIRPALGLGQAHTEVEAVRPAEGGADYEVLVNFLGLYGLSSPLPHFYTEDLIEAEQDDRRGARQFLDIIHQRLYQLYARGLSKHRPLHRTLEQGAPDWPQLLWSLVGLREASMREPLAQPQRLIRYIGLLGPRQRSAQGLETLLRNVFPEVGFTIHQCVERSVRVPAKQRLRLGRQANRLGESAILGQWVADRRGKLAITVGPMPERLFTDLINVGEQWSLLISLIRFYLNTPLECELRFVLAEGEGRTAQLGSGDWGQLGRSTWLYSGAREDRLEASLKLG